MAKRNQAVFIDPHFDEYVHSWLLDLSTEDMRSLSTIDLRKIQKGKHLRRFVGQGRLDEKLLLLAKTGMEFFIIMAPKNVKASMRHLKPFMKRYFTNGLPADKSENTDKLVQDKTFVLGSAQVLLASYYLHQNCQNDYYRMNRQFQKLYIQWEMAGKNLGKNRTTGDIKEIAKGADVAIEFAFKILKNHALYANFGLSGPMDFLILLYLMRKNRTFDKRTSFTPQQTLYGDINEGTYSPEGFGRRLAWLSTNGYIHKDSTYVNKPAYAIADRGIRVVMEYTTMMVERISIDI